MAEQHFSLKRAGLAHRLIGLLFFLKTACFSLSMSAQELELFESTETESRAQESSNRGQVVRDREGNVITGPHFTLTGTSRFGDNYVLILKDRLGDTISMDIPGNQSPSIPGYPEFQVLRIGAGDVSIRYPDGMACIEFREQGVSCDASFTGKVSLTNAEPLESSSAASQDAGAQNIGELSAADSPDNPFEALLQRAANQNTDVEESTFEPVRINPSDVPPGMRVVSTPFGDRLVEDDC